MRTIESCAVLRALMLLFLLTALSTQAAEPQKPSTQEASEEELVKQTQNPVADLISVPFQNNFNFEAGPKHNHQIYLLNIQPVIPIHITENWNLISRIIMPVINLPSLAPGIGSATGLGDFNPTFFLSPAKSGELIWGAGPTFTLPTATDKLLGDGKFSLGPAAVALTIQGHWVVGVLMNNQWSVAGWGSGHVNEMLIQPFVNYNLPDHWYLVSAPIMTANWAAAKGGDVWTARSVVASANCSGWARYFHWKVMRSQSSQSTLNFRRSVTSRGRKMARSGSCASNFNFCFRSRSSGKCRVTLTGLLE